MSVGDGCRRGHILCLLYESGWSGIKNIIVKKQQLFGIGSRCEEHPRDVFCPFVELNPQQLACPAQVPLLREVFTTAEHQVIALRGRPLKHQQPQLILLGQHQPGYTRHTLLHPDLLLLSRKPVRSLEVNIHTHRPRDTFAALQRAVGIGQTRVVHLSQQALLRGILLADGLQRLALPVRIAAAQILLSVVDGAHELCAAIPLVNLEYAHSRYDLWISSRITFCAMLLA